MRTRYQVGGRIVHFEVDDGSESIIIELSRASLSSDPDLIVRDSRARHRRGIGTFLQFVESGDWWSGWNW